MLSGGAKGGLAGAMAPPKLRHIQEYIYSLNFVCLNIYTLNFVHRN
jgi:hypothetical protein